MANPVKAWHFLADDYRLRYGDRRKVKAGDLITVDCKPVLCESGLHASIKPLDALRYAPGPIACRVVISGDVVRGDDKIVGTERYVEWTLDATWILHEFACWCAERALNTANVTDERCWNAINTKMKWLRGEATDDELAAASDAAWDAARGAAWDAAWAAASDAAWAAAWDAAWAAARGAARGAASDAAWDAAWAKQNRKLESMLMESE